MQSTLDQLKTFHIERGLKKVMQKSDLHNLVKICGAINTATSAVAILLIVILL